MPRMDGTGPGCMGLRTGRGQGRCAGAAEPGIGPGMGLGRGCRHGFQGGGRGGFGRLQAVDPVQEKGWLTRQAEVLETRLAAIKQRLAHGGAETK